MTRQAIDTSSVLGQLERTLETSCAVLVSLQAFREGRAGLARELSGIERQVETVIDQVRGTIATVRAASDEAASMLAFGFVLDATLAGAGAVQARPRRTA